MYTSQKIALLGMVVLILLSFYSTSLLAKKQDDGFRLQEELYVQAYELHEEQNDVEAEQKIQRLLQLTPTSEATNELAARIYHQLSQPAKTVTYAANVLELNPHRVEDLDFLLLYSEALTNNSQFPEAHIVYSALTEQMEPAFYKDHKKKLNTLKQTLEQQLGAIDHNA